MAPRGRGRGHGRGRTSNQKLETDTNNPVNFMAALESMAATMQATTKALGQQMKMAVERALQVQLVPEVQCVEFATYQLTGEALHWWQETRCLVEFYKRYFPNLVRTAKELELLQLKQGAMSVPEYTNKFKELCRFSHICQGAPRDFEEWKCIKFEGGLWSDILSSTRPMEIRTFLELVNKSRVAKDCMRRVAAEKGSHKMSFQQNQGRSFATRGQTFKHGGFVPEQTQGQTNFRRPNNNNYQGKRVRKQPLNEQACARCGSHHPGVPCKAGWGLFIHVERRGIKPQTVRRSRAGKTLNALFDSGAAHSFIAFERASELALKIVVLDYDLIVHNANSEAVVTRLGCPQVSFQVKQRDFVHDLICLPMVGSDLILGLDWLSKNHVLLDYSEKSLYFMLEES
ncbi:uncharacterized protein LOC130978756 [Arachis stenosperma]|uniref:uncharacterized protein LOC130978756 n=1 Tax=Arachis stenosperma TaxID=217475 RepID=UPI0025AD8C23|nr:uncharacterized protein LOC130978756 [Arachis stenosperma]